MAFFTVVLALALACWLIVAARGGDTDRADPAAVPAAPEPSRPSAHADRHVRGVDQLADLRRARQGTRHQQAA